MKKLLLLTAVLFCFVRGVQAWNGTSFPASSFRSTSSMAGAGSSLPMAAADGARLAGNTPQYIGGIGAARSPMDDDPFGGETIDDITLPEEPGNYQPVGDAVPPLLLLAIAYMTYSLLKRRKKNLRRFCV